MTTKLFIAHTYACVCVCVCVCAESAISQNVIFF